MIFTLPALILDKSQAKEIDLLVYLLTPKGKICAVAKGAQKSKKRFLNLLEDLTYVRAHLRKPQKGKGLILEGVDLIYLPESPRRDLKKFYFFSYIAETLTYTYPPFLRGEDFLFIVRFIEELDRSEISMQEKFFWNFKWLQICGLKPHLERCLSCGDSPRKIFYFSIPRGGILCHNCKEDSAKYLTFNQIDLLRKVVRIKTLEDLREAMSRVTLEEIKGVSSLMKQFFLFHFNWEPKSLKVMEESYALG